MKLPNEAEEIVNLKHMEKIDFQNVGIKSRNKRITIENLGIPIRITKYEIYSENSNIIPDFNIETQSCPSTESQENLFVHGISCILTLTWTPTEGEPLETYATEFLIHYQADIPDSNGNLKPIESYASIQLAGTPISNIQINQDGEIIQSLQLDSNGQPIGNYPGSQPQIPQESLEERNHRIALEEWNRARAASAFTPDQNGNVPSIAQMPDYISEEEKIIQEEIAFQQRVETGNLTHQDYTSLGLAPGSGVSSRPVSLAATILAGTYIPVTLAQSIDSREPTPVTGVIIEDIYSAQGRNVVIPKGSKIFGNSVPTSLPQNLIASAGLLSDSDNDNESDTSADLLTASPNTSYEGRLKVVWDRIILPDGTAFRPSGALSTLDLMGRSGIPGHYDRKELQTFLIAVTNIATQVGITGLLGNDIWVQTTTTADGTTTATFDQEPGTPSIIGGTENENENIDNSVASVSVTKITKEQQARSQFLESTTAELRKTLRSTLPPQPELQVPIGTKIIVVPTQDLWLQSIQGRIAQQNSEDKNIENQGISIHTPRDPDNFGAQEIPEEPVPQTSSTQAPTISRSERDAREQLARQEQEQALGGDNLLGLPTLWNSNPQYPVDPTFPQNSQNPNTPQGTDNTQVPQDYQPQPGSTGF